MSASRISWGRFVGLACLIGVTWAAWDTWAVYPIRIFTTFLHEMGHAVGAWVSGGSVDRIIVRPDGSGECLVRGGWPIISIPAGYLGSMAAGSLLVLAACRTKHDRQISLVVGLGFVGCVAFYVRSWFDFWYGLAWGAALASAGWWLPEAVNDAMLRFLGCASCLYAFFDLRTLWRLGSGATTDATLMAREVFPLPARVWAALWSVLAFACVVKTLQLSVRRS